MDVHAGSGVSPGFGKMNVQEGFEELQMKDWLERFRDWEVEIHYLTDNNAYKDRGRLVDFGSGWLELFKPTSGDRGETFAIPVSSIRIMKILSPARLPADDVHLLRPVELGESISEIENETRIG